MASVLRRVAAFTLIELLVVLLIVSIVMGVAALNLRATGRVVACQQMTRLAGIVSQLNDMAILQQRTFVLSIDTRAVRVMQAQQDLFAGTQEHRLVPVQGDTVAMPQWSDFHFAVAPVAAQVIFFKDGTVTPMQWHFFAPDIGRVALSVSTIGHVQILGGCAANA